MKAMPIDTDRSAIMNIGGTEYEMTFTVRAAKEITKRYGKLEALGDKIFGDKDFDEKMDEVVWLITLLANQGVLRHNLRHREAPMDELTPEAAELLISPFDLADYKDAIMRTVGVGAKRHVESEEPKEKNAVDG